jgi:hypothetical protein
MESFVQMLASACDVMFYASIIIMGISFLMMLVGERLHQHLNPDGKLDKIVNAVESVVLTVCTVSQVVFFITMVMICIIGVLALASILYSFFV